jgi:hypothetical protein
MKYRNHITGLKVKVERMTDDLKRIQNDNFYSPLAKDEAKRSYFNKRDELLEDIGRAKNDLQMEIVAKTKHLAPKEFSKADKEQLMFDYRYNETLKGEKLNDQEVLSIWSKYFNKDITSHIEALPPTQKAMIVNAYNEANNTYLEAVADVDVINRITNEAYLQINSNNEFEIVEPYTMTVIERKYTTEI